MTDAEPEAQPPETPEPARGKTVMLVALGGSALLFLATLVVALVVLLRPAGTPSVTDPSTPVPTPVASASPTPTPTVAPPPRDEEQEARKEYEAAEAAERAQSDRPDLTIAAYRTVRVRYPQTTWAARAEQRTRELEERIRRLFEAEFEGVRRDAKALRDAGNYRGALDALRKYQESGAKEILKKRADVEIAAVENEARKKFNAAVKEAQALVKKGSHEQAAALFRSLIPFAPDDVRSAAESEIESVASGRASWNEALARQAEDAAEDRFLALGPRLLDRCRARRFDEALKALDALPASPLKADERELVSAAAAFWDAFLRALRARVGQDVSLVLADGTRAGGKLAKVLDDRAVVGSVEVTFDRLHDDQIVLVAVGRGGLAETAADSYVKAAMFFFCAGKRELSRLYLATARELGANIEQVERAWRGGAIRAALVAAAAAAAPPK